MYIMYTHMYVAIYCMYIRLCIRTVYQTNKHASLKVPYIHMHLDNYIHIHTYVRNHIYTHACMYEHALAKRGSCDQHTLNMCFSMQCTNVHTSTYVQVHAHACTTRYISCSRIHAYIVQYTHGHMYVLEHRLWSSANICKFTSYRGSMVHRPAEWDWLCGSCVYSYSPHSLW